MPVIDIKEDYHGNMNAQFFKNWFEEMLLNVRNQLMDGAGYPRQRIDGIPTSGSSKADMVAWLEKVKIAFDPVQTKAELCKIIKENKEKHLKFMVKELARYNGFEVIYTPPYNPDFQPIETLWGVIKNSLSSEQTSMTDLGERIEAAKDNVAETAWVGAWNKTCKHARAIVEKADNEDFAYMQSEDEQVSDYSSEEETDEDSE